MTSDSLSLRSRGRILSNHLDSCDFVGLRHTHVRYCPPRGFISLFLFEDKILKTNRRSEKRRYRSFKSHEISFGFPKFPELLSQEDLS